MYVYIKTEPQLWTVGHYWPDGRFEPESDHDNSESAAQRVAWLNGSSAAPGTRPYDARAHESRYPTF